MIFMEQALSVMNQHVKERSLSPELPHNVKLTKVDLYIYWFIFIHMFGYIVLL